MLQLLYFCHAIRYNGCQRHGFINNGQVPVPGLSSRELIYCVYVVKGGKLAPAFMTWSVTCLWYW